MPGQNVMVPFQDACVLNIEGFVYPNVADTLLVFVGGLREHVYDLHCEELQVVGQKDQLQLDLPRVTVRQLHEVSEDGLVVTLVVMVVLHEEYPLLAPALDRGSEPSVASLEDQLFGHLFETGELGLALEARGLLEGGEVELVEEEAGVAGLDVLAGE